MLERRPARTVDARAADPEVIDSEVVDPGAADLGRAPVEGHGRHQGRFPGYDVLAKRDGPSWNEPTRRAVEERLAVPRTPRFFTEDEFAAVGAVAARLVPQASSAGEAQIPVAALVDHKLHAGTTDGYRGAGMPRQDEAWRRGLRALDAEAHAEYSAPFAGLPPAAQDELLRRMHAGELQHPAWAGMPCDTFFKQRLAHDVVLAYYSHPTAWNQIGWGGPASPRGYVRMGYDEHDPWEATEAKPDAAPGERDAALRKNRRAR